MTDDTNLQDQQSTLDQLVKDLGIDTLSQEKQNDFVIKMTEVLLKRIFIETMEKLGDHGREEYGKLTEGDQASPEQVEAFFKDRISNYDEMVQKVIVDFKMEMMKTE
jgi:hypothetical protein